MSNAKRYTKIDVLTASRERVKYIFDNFDNIYLSFSGGKDSSVMFHLVMDEAIKRERKVGILLIDLEAQYSKTIQHAEAMFDIYEDYIDLHWVCLPMKLRNAVSNFQPTWTAWGPESKEVWVRDLPTRKGVVSDPDYYPFFIPGMEFEEFIVLWGEWYANGIDTAAFVGIRADESLNRFRTICTFKKETYNKLRYTTKIIENLYNVYPIYDWRTEDIWRYHSKYPEKDHNEIYDMMYKAGVPLSQQRLCQPFGDDQKRGLWLYHLLEGDTWYKLISRVNGVNSGSLYVQESGNVTGYRKIYKPDNHTWKSFFMLLFSTMPKITQEHYLPRFRSFISGWKKRGYKDGIPDEAPVVLENAQWAPSWRRMCKVLLRNDWWCKGLGLTQPKSDAYGKYLEIKKARKTSKEAK